MAILLTLAAITIGIGALYIGLPEARHRRKVLNAVEIAFRSQPLDEDTQREINEKLKKVKKFANDYHALATWRSELPNSPEPTGTALDLFEDTTEPGKTPWYYRWFQLNLDKITCTLLAIVIPLVGLWLVQFEMSDKIDGFIEWAPCVLLVAHGWVALNVAVGYFITWYIPRNVRSKINRCISKLDVDIWYTVSDRSIR